MTKKPAITPSSRPVVSERCIIRDAQWADLAELLVVRVNGEIASLEQRDIHGTLISKRDEPIASLFRDPYAATFERWQGAQKTGRPQLQDPPVDETCSQEIKAGCRYFGREGKTRSIKMLVQFLTEKLPHISPSFIEGCVKCLVIRGVISVRLSKGEYKFKLCAFENVRERTADFASRFAEELTSQSDRIRGLIEHKPTSGGYREELLREVLRTHLPRRFHVATGFVLRSPHQIDILIYDQLEFPAVFRQGDVVVVDAQAVRALIEVKTTLTKKFLQGAVRHLSNVVPDRLLQGAVFKGIFAFGSSMAEGSILDALADVYDANLFGFDSVTIGDPVEILSAVCVADKHFVHGHFGLGEDDDGPFYLPGFVAKRSFFGRRFQTAAFYDLLDAHLRTFQAKVDREKSLFSNFVGRETYEADHRVIVNHPWGEYFARRNMDGDPADERRFHDRVSAYRRLVRGRM